MEGLGTANSVTPPDGTRWRSRKVSYRKLDFSEILSALPEFDLRPFTAGEGEPSNPYLRTVIRLPLERGDRPIPIGVVSHTYSLASHRDVANVCLNGLKDVGINPADLRYEVGLSELGEWMNLRIYFPADFGFVETQGNKLDLRLECFNSVDGWSRLVVLLGWYRLVCSNGMVIGETKIEIKERHGAGLDLWTIRLRLRPALEAVEGDRARMSRWQQEKVRINEIRTWADNEVSARWGKKAAARVFHICNVGQDVEIDPFARGTATQKRMHYLGPVPGSPQRAKTMYDVSQSLSFVATHRKNVEERVAWQADIPRLLEQLRVY